MSKKKRTILLSLIGITAVFAIFLGYFNMQINALVNLGYSKKTASSKTNVSNLIDVVANEKKVLSNKIDKVMNDLNSLGVKIDDINKLKSQSSNLVTEYNLLTKEYNAKVQYYSTELSKLEAKAKKYKIKYKYPDENIYHRNIYLNSVITKNYRSLILEYRKLLTAQGYSKADLLKLNTNNSQKTLNNLQNALAKEKRKLASQLNQFASKELRDSAMRMFKETNEYRASKGLKPYKYNYKMQSCVFKEANAYARNKNPHNWACQPIANENAGLAGVNTDYVKLAMDFFKSDPPHEQVLLGNHNSVAIAIVTKDGMNYMIMDVFN